MKALILPALACLLATLSPATAQNEPGAGNTQANQRTTDRESDGSRRRFWEANLPGGNYMVALDRITSISRHSYAVMEASVIVDEVIVDTVGQAVVRFYFIRPLTEGVNSSTVSGLTNRAKELLDYGAQRAGTNAHNMVVKKYPEGNYAKTIEFRVHSAEELGALYGSVRTAWDNNRGRIFNVK